MVCRCTTEVDKQKIEKRAEVRMQPDMQLERCVQGKTESVCSLVCIQSLWLGF